MSSFIERIEVLPLLEKAQENNGMFIYPVQFEVEQDDGTVLRTEGRYSTINSGIHEFFNYGVLSKLIESEEDLKFLQETIRMEIKDELNLPLLVLREWKCDECGKSVQDDDGVLEFYTKEQSKNVDNFEVIETHVHGFHIVHRGCKYDKAFLQATKVKTVQNLDLDTLYASKVGFFLGLYESKLNFVDKRQIREVFKRLTIPYYEIIRQNPELLKAVNVSSPFQTFERRVLRNIALER